MLASTTLPEQRPEKSLFVYGGAWNVPIDEASIQEAWGEFRKGLSASSIKNGYLRIALIHKYMWINGHSHPGAPEENNV